MRQQRISTVERKKLGILPMTPVLFEQRKRVIGLIYDAKAIMSEVGIDNLPWINTRICVSPSLTGSPTVLGCAWKGLGQPFISIKDEMKEWDDLKLKHVVWHELLHAWFSIQHTQNDPLMRAIYSSAPETQLIQSLKNWGLSRRISEI